MRSRPGVAVDHVVAAVSAATVRDVADEAGRLDLLEQRGRLVRVGDELDVTTAVVAEDDVVVAGHGAVPALPIVPAPSPRSVAVASPVDVAGPSRLVERQRLR